MKPFRFFQSAVRNPQSAILLAFAAALPACDSPTRTNGPSPQSGLPTTTMTIGSRNFTLEIAATDEQRNIGLMHRDSMPADHGMIFLFRSPRTLSFWMRNTRIPLDILYLDADGKIVSIHQMKPLDLTGIPSKGPAKFAVELNQGMAAAAGVKDGDQLRLPDQVLSIKPDASLAP